jgi:hypothetical protein
MLDMTCDTGPFLPKYSLRNCSASWAVVDAFNLVSNSFLAVCNVSSMDSNDIEVDVDACAGDPPSNNRVPIYVVLVAVLLLVVVCDTEDGITKAEHVVSNNHNDKNDIIIEEGIIVNETTTNKLCYATIIVCLRHTT